jgi:hypothetical protein
VSLASGGILFYYLIPTLISIYTQRLTEMLPIIQASKLFSLFDEKRKIKEIEFEIIQDFIDSFSLKLVWYKRVDSTAQRGKMNVNLNQFAKDNLPLQKYISPIRKNLFDLKFDGNYILDDYIILAQL